MTTSIAPRQSAVCWAVALAAMAVLAVGAFVAAGSASAGGTPEFQSGDVVVGSGQTQTYENRTVILTGNLTVAAGGSLVLRNSTFLLNVTSNGSLTLTVQAGGDLRLLDLDGAPQTLLDSSEIGSADATLRYLASFDSNAGVLIRNSALTGFGYSLAVPGLSIASDNVTFDNATLRSYTFLRVQSASPRFFGTLFEGEGAGSNYFLDSAAVLLDCTFARHFVAVSAGQGSSLTLRNAVVRDSAFSVASNGAAVAMSGALFNNTSAGVYLNNVSHITFTDVLFDEGLVAFDDNASVLEVRRALSVVVLNAVAEPVRGANVTLRNATGALVGADPTDTGGTAGPFPVLLYLQNATSRLDEGNYTVNVSKPGNATGHNFSPFNESFPITLALASNIDPRMTLLSPSPGAALLAAIDQVFEVQVSDPDGPTASLTVTWASSIGGPMGSGARLVAPLSPGIQTIVVEVRDAQDGWRTLSFNITADAGQLEVFTDGSDPPAFEVEMWKAALGGVEILPLAGPAPDGAVGGAFDVHAANGTLQWSWAILTVRYAPTDLWYGINNTSLRLVRVGPGGALVDVSGSLLNETALTVTANVSALGAGLGTFLIVGSKGSNLPPDFHTPPRLVAVRGVSFTFTLEATDSPGDELLFSLFGAPAWLSVDAGAGTVAGTPTPEARGLLNITVVVADQFGANTTGHLEVFVTGPAANQPPRLANAVVLPSNPVAGAQVVFQVTYYDGDDDAPIVIEIEIDGTAYALEPVNIRDVNFTDGKDYVYRTVLAAGNHSVVYRVNDGYPSRADIEPIETSLVVAPDVALQLDNWFLALLASVAATLFIVLWLAARAPRDSKAEKPKPSDSENSIAFVEGAALKPIPPPPPRLKAEPKKADKLEAEADILAGVAKRDEKEAAEKLKAPRVVEEDD